MLEKKPASEVRNVRFGGSVTKKENQLITNLAKKYKISKTELIIRAVQYYKDNYNEK